MRLNGEGVIEQYERLHRGSAKHLPLNFDSQNYAETG